MNPVNVNVAATYTVTYNVSDAAGNPADEVHYFDHGAASTAREFRENQENDPSASTEATLRF